MTPITCEVVGLSNGRATHLYPRLDGLDRVVDFGDNARDVGPSLVGTDLDFPRFGIANVVQMNAVNVVTLGDFPANFCQIIGRLWLFGVHISVFSDLYNQVGKTLSEPFTAQTIPFSDRNSDHPCMQFHASFVAFFDGKAERIIARSGSGKPT